MSTEFFIGRKAELKKLKDLSSVGQAALVVIKGRRRIGKSRLAEEYAKNKVFLPFTGLAPIDGVTAQDQREAFGRQLSMHFKLSPVSFTDWSDAFNHLGHYLTAEPTIILFDEISWMATKDPTFLPKLKAWWDLVLQKRPNVMLILCGSVSTWIEKNILNSTAFFGRIALQITLEELSLPESYAFLQMAGMKASVYEILEILSVTGGVPWYLERIISTQTVDENLRRLCFEKGGLLVGEFELIFHDLFSHKGNIYRQIVSILSEGMCHLSELRKRLGYALSGSLSDHIKALMTSGFVTQHKALSLKTGHYKQQSLYRLSDSYLRFYLKYIEPNLSKIDKNAYSNTTLRSLPGWEAMMGFQVENLLLNNWSLLLNALGLYPHEVVADNPYWQHSTKRHPGCQVDYLIKTYTNTLFVCEFKFQRRSIYPEIIDIMKEKLQAMIIPHGYGVCPVLVHVGEVSPSVYDKHYFYRIIDVTDLLTVEHASNFM